MKETIRKYGIKVKWSDGTDAYYGERCENCGTVTLRVGEFQCPLCHINLQHLRYDRSGRDSVYASPSDIVTSVRLTRIQDTSYSISVYLHFNEERAYGRNLQ